MKDDLANDWGTMLATNSGSKKRQKTVSGNIGKGKHKFYDAVHKDCEPFCLHRLFTSGSDANAWAISAATNLKQQNCLFGIGTYVGGDWGPFERMSTSKEDTSLRLCWLSDPDKITNDEQKKMAIALPYHVKNEEFGSDEIEKLENECLCEVHRQFLIKKAMGNDEITVILEIMLGGNGGNLSDGFLRRFGKLAEKHNVKIIVDEVLTGGRNGTMLFCQTLPEEFVSQVCYVTMGKWTGCGMVLFNINHEVGRKIMEKNDEEYRGVSTALDVTDPHKRWISVRKQIKNSERRRMQVLEKLCTNEDDAWGKGVVIFAPIVRKDNKAGLSQRFLPMLNLGTEYKIKLPRKNENDNHVSKIECNEVMVETVRKWIESSKTINHMGLRKVVDALCKQKAVAEHMNKRDMIAFVQGNEQNIDCNKNEIKEGINYLIQSGMLTWKQKGKKRKKGYVQNELFQFGI